MAEGAGNGGAGLEIEALTVVVPPNATILDGVSMRASPGRLSAVIGPNGAGKSTLLKCVAGLMSPVGGSRVSFGGDDLGRLKRRRLASVVSYLTQSTQPVPSTVFDAVLLGRRPHVSWRPGRADREICRRTIDELGLGEFAEANVEEISGGEFQKVLIARALVQGAPVLLLDEPINHLDIKNQIETMELVSSLTRRRGLVTLIVLHDLNLALRYADDVVLLDLGRALHRGPRETLTGERLSEAYGMEIRIETVLGRPRVLY